MGEAVQAPVGSEASGTGERGDRYFRRQRMPPEHDKRLAYPVGSPDRFRLFPRNGATHEHPSPIRAIPLRRRVLHYLAVESQLGSRRNAMIASTALAQRRAERIAVEEFFAGLQEATAATAVRG